MKLTICICTYNRSESLKRCIKSINKLVNQSSIKISIIIVDNSKNFNVIVLTPSKFFTGFFSFDGKYENSLALSTKQKKVTINRVFSPPNDQNLILQITLKLSILMLKLVRSIPHNSSSSSSRCRPVQ